MRSRLEWEVRRQCKNTIKQLSNDFHGNTEWSDEWDGSYKDHVKGLIAQNTQTGSYNNLPQPLGPSSSWQVARTMQLAIVPAGDKWHVIKHFMFEELQKLIKVAEELACGTTYCHSWWPHNPWSSKKYSRRYSKGLVGFRFDTANGKEMTMIRRLLISTNSQLDMHLCAR